MPTTQCHCRGSEQRPIPAAPSRKVSDPVPKIASMSLPWRQRAPRAFPWVFTPDTKVLPVSEGARSKQSTSAPWPWKLCSSCPLSTSHRAHVPSPLAVRICPQKRTGRVLLLWLLSGGSQSDVSSGTGKRCLLEHTHGHMPRGICGFKHINLSHILKGNHF